MRTLCGHGIFTVEVPSVGPELRPPLLVLHGFPSSSFDFHRVVDRLAADRRVLLFDMLGYGLSDKPDLAYTFGLQADIAMALVDEVGTHRLALLTHDVGDTVGGELLARNLEDRWPVEITGRVLTNGSIYMRWVRLSDGQRFLLDLPDQRLAEGSGPDRDTVVAGITATFSPLTVVGDDELSAQWEMIAHLDGQLLLPRLIRYVEERRRHEERFTGAIEGHPSPLTVVWGRDDPIAVAAMAEALADLGNKVHLLDGVGHYPMLEAPDRFLAALSTAP
jgi:pimeloyl-ACP methyl ester carboxylesterase